MTPNNKNACSGCYPDWLEVNLLPECNGKCSWCIEKQGWHPTTKTTWQNMSYQIIASNKKNVILLGGEPTLYPNLFELVKSLIKENINVWITTNGSKLTPTLVTQLNGIKGVNLSLHHYDLIKNQEITGIKLNQLPND